MCSCYCNRLTFLFHLALYVWVVDDLANSYAAKDRAQRASMPTKTVRAVEESQAQVTGEIGTFTEQGRLKRSRNIS